MKIELEILESDLEDWKKIIELKKCIKEHIEGFSEFSKNNCINQIENLKNAVERVEDSWLFNQRKRAENKLSEALNVNCSRFNSFSWE